MKMHRIKGGGGVGLHVVEAGNPKGRPILFIHGISQCSLAWGRQFASDLAERHRLVAIDLRGHGLSDKPKDGYADTKSWADDVNAVVRTLELDHPVLVGWSYGPLVILDYIRHYGEEAIGGVQLVGGVSKLGSDAAMAVLTPEFIALVPGFFAENTAESARSLEALLRLCLVEEPTAAELYTMLGYNLSVPHYVRHALLTRSLDNDDVLKKIRKPVLLTHGAKDAVVKPAVVELHKAAMPHAQIHMVPGAGHAPFWDDAPGFNRRLAEFTGSLGH